MERVPFDRYDERTMILKYFTWKEWAYTAVCGFFVIVQVYLDLRIPEYMTVITDAIMNHSPVDVVYGYGADMVICALVSMVVSFLATIMSVLAATSLCRSLRQRLFDKVGEFTPQDVENFSVDSLITRSTNDVTQVQQFIVRAMQTVIRVPIISVWALVKISGSEWEWTAVTAAGVIIMVVLMGSIIWYTRPRFKRVPKLTDSINHFSLEHLTGIRVVRAYNAESFQEKNFKEASDALKDNSINIWKKAGLLPGISGGINNLLTVAIYWLGIVLISGSEPSHQTVLFSDMIVFSSYAGQILNAFMRLAMLIQYSARAMESSRRIQELINYAPCIEDGSYLGDGTDPGTVEFDHVCFEYPGTGAEVLHDISFRIERGQTVAIMGATGSGKSTLMNLILRFYRATEGKVTVSGVDVNEYDRRNLYRQVSYVPQVNTIFTGTVEHNVNYGSTSAERDMDDIRMAESIAQASEFVDELEGRESFHITEEGRNLSGGQRQRISIARAVCKDAPIWILDDPFSALDFLTDKKLRSSIEIERKDPTKILVAQRVGTVMNSDLIIVLDEGRIVGKGKHDELMRDCQIYREMAISQMTEGTY